MKHVTALGAILALLLAPVLVRLLKAQSPPQGSAASFAVSPPAVAYVGSVFNVSVTAFDPSSNAAKSYTGTVHFTSTDPQAVLPPDYTFTTGDSGTHMFSATLNTPGTHTITATDTANGAITGTSNSITVSATPPPPPPTFTLTDLGPLQITAAPAGATAFNASGQVTGFRFENFPSPVCFAGGADRAFLWNNGVYTELGTLGGFSSFGYGINKAGQIVGSSDICPNGIETGQRAFIWQNGTMTALDPSTNSNDSSVAFAINANGDVAGYTNHVGNAANPQAVIWKGGTAAGLAMLQSLACQFTACQTRALAINDSGQAAGWGMGPFVHGLAGSYNANQAVMWDANGQSTGLGSLGNFWSDQANAINSKGDVAGYSQLDPGVYYSIVRAVVWQNGNPQNPQDLGTIPGFDPIFGSGVNITDNSSSAWGINSKGDIVGISGYGSNAAILGNGGRAFLYIPTPAPGTGGQTYDLLSLLAPGTNWRRLEAAWAINDNNQILGVGIDANQQEHGFLLTPIITPTTTAVTTSGTPSVFGQSVSFTATVTPVPPNSNAVNDTVTFYDGNTTLGSGTYNGNGMWIFNTTAPLSVGNHSITASYNGDNTFGASTSTVVTQTVGQAGTVTGLAASPNTVNVGQTVTFTATVTVAAPGAGSPSGAVTFSGNGAQLTCTGGSQTVSAGQATCQYVFGAAGAESITASYGGDTNFTGSTTASSVTVTVQNPPPPIVQVVQVTDNETIHVADAESFADVYDSEAVHVADAAFVTPLIQVSAPVAEFSLGTLGFSGQSGSQAITVSDIGTASLTVASATISGSSQFTVTQIACSNSSASFSTTLPSGGACILTIGYSASAAPANDTGTLQFADNAALSNLATVASGSNYTQSIALSGGGSTTAPPPPPPAVVPVMDNETITVTDSASFAEAFDSEQISVADQVSVIPCDFTLSANSPLNVPVGGSGSTSITITSVNGCTLPVSLSAPSPFLGATTSLPATATTGGSSTSATLTVTAGPSVTPTSFTVTITGTSGLIHSVSVNVNITASIAGTMGVVQTLLNAGAINNSGVAGALTGKLSAAQSAPNAQTSINTVKAFQNQVQAQAGKHIATSLTLAGVTFNPASTLMANGQALIDSMRVSMIPDPITGYVVNQNGVDVAGATLSILDAGGHAVASATTDVTGFYFFATMSVLTTGSSYTVSVTGLPAGFASATPAMSPAFAWSGSGLTIGNFVLSP